MKRKVLALILCLVFLFSMSGMAMSAPQNGYYVNGHRFELTLTKTDAAYFNFLADMKAIGWDYSKLIIVNNNQFADYQEAIDEGDISSVLQPNAHQQVGSSIPNTIIPISNEGKQGPSEAVSNTAEDIVYASTNALTITLISVENGTTEADAIAQLQTTVGVLGTKGETGTASIAWSIAGYNADAADDYTATGVLTLPAGWTGSAADVSATVTVEAAIPTAYASTDALTNTAVSIANGTAEADAKAQLQTAVGVLGTKGETGIASIAWSIAGYNATAAGDYTATGVLTLPAGWTGSAADVTAVVTVQAPISPAYASTNALTTTTVSVENGTAEAAAKALLQASVGVVGTKGETGSASIAWSIAGYNATAAGDYTATGVLSLPAGWTGSAADVTATVTVQAPASFSTAVQVIDNAIAKFQPVGASGKFIGAVKKVLLGQDRKVNKCDFVAATTTINTAKEQNALLTVNIETLASSDKSVPVAAFPFAEFISGSGAGSAAVSSGALTQDDNYYYIQLTNVDCPASMLAIITAAGNCNSSYALTFSSQKMTGKIKVSKTSGLVDSLYDITITGKTTIKSSLVNGTYDNVFTNNGNIVFIYP